MDTYQFYSLLQTFFNDLHSVEELCTVDLYHLGTRSLHGQMDMLLSSCKQIHKAGFLSSILHSEVFVLK